MRAKTFKTKTTLKLKALGLAVLLGSTAPAWAADYCIDINGAKLTIKAFSLPLKGACKQVHGFLGDGPLASFATGSACKSTDGSHVSFVLTRSGGPPSIARGIDVLHLDLPAATGAASLCTVDTGLGGHCTANLPIAHVSCTPVTVPVP